MCCADPPSPWYLASAPLAPPLVTQPCSQGSLLLRQDLIPRDRASSASAPSPPDADSRRMPLANPEASRFPYKERPCMPGSQTTSGRAGPRAIAPAHVAFRTQDERRHPRSVIFAVQWRPTRSLSTLHGRPRGRPRMTWGQCGSLLLHCDGLAPSTPCRSPGAPCSNPYRRRQPVEGAVIARLTKLQGQVFHSQMDWLEAFLARCSINIFDRPLLADAERSGHLGCDPSSWADGDHGRRV